MLVLQVRCCTHSYPSRRPRYTRISAVGIGAILARLRVAGEISIPSRGLGVCGMVLVSRDLFSQLLTSFGIGVGRALGRHVVSSACYSSHLFPTAEVPDNDGDTRQPQDLCGHWLGMMSSGESCHRAKSFSCRIRTA